MSTLMEFFQGADSSLGLFYPNHYIVAVFPSPDVAEHAARKLRNAGFEDSQAIATDGNAIIDLLRE